MAHSALVMNNHRLPESLLDDIALAIKTQTSIPPLPKGITVEDAYLALPHLVKRVTHDRPGGLKAGVTNTDIQAFLGLDEALLGMLYDASAASDGLVLPFVKGRKIECEMGIRLNADGSPLAVGPAVELVNLDFSVPEDLTAGNLVLCNMGTDRFILGNMKPWDQFDFSLLTEVEITVIHDGKTRATTSPLDSLGGPQSALDWCVSKSAMLKLPITQNCVLLTGTCGAALPGEPGHYEVNYGALGSIRFSITDA
jgi:2-keto-4-pentenoate hydratase